MDEKLKKVLAEASPVQDKLEVKVQNAFHLGNGDMTALVMGDEKGFSVSVTKNDIWDIRMNTENDHEIISDARVRELAMGTPFGERTLLVNLDSNARINGGKDSYDDPYPCPVICARFTITAEMEQAVHKLNLENAAVESSLRTGTQRFFIAYNHNILVVDGLSEENKEELVPVCHTDMEPPVLSEQDGRKLLLQYMPGDLDVAGYYYALGFWRVDATKLAVSVYQADNAQDATAGAVEILDRYAQDAALFAEHKAAWEAHWSRSYIELDDKILQTVWYRNIYLLGSCAKPGCASPALYTGLNTDTPYWHGDFHMNYNYQAIFSGAFITNHCELAEVYDDFMLWYLRRAKWVAKTVYGVEGAFYPHAIYLGEPMDPENCKSKNNRQYFHHVWGRTLGNTAMAVQDMLWHWYYDPSQELLEKIYPVLRESADFYYNIGDLREAITVSPEHWGITPQLILNHESTFDITFIKYLMKGCIKAAKTLGVDEEKQKMWQEYLDHMPDYPTTEDYEKQRELTPELYENDIRDCWNYLNDFTYEGKVIVDIKNAPPSRLNLPGPILPVFPGGDIDLSSPMEEQKLALDSFNNMVTTGWDDFIIGAAARVRMQTADMHSYMHERLRDQMMPSGFLASGLDLEHYFENQGIYTQMMGITVAISEQMLQSNKGFIRLFPSMPEGGNGRFEHLLAEGGVLVSAVRKNGVLESAVLEPKYDGSICLCVPNGREPQIYCDGQPVACELFINDGGEEVIRFMGIAGKVYNL